MLSKPLSLETRFVTLVIIFSIITGCSGDSQRLKVVEVKGQVFLGEKPLAFGQVIFQPIQGGQPAAGEIDSKGFFSLATYSKSDGAIVGRHKVRVVSYTSQDPNNPSKDSSGDALGDLLIPSRYASFATSGIEVSILESGNAPFIFKLNNENTDQLDGQALSTSVESDNVEIDASDLSKKADVDSTFDSDLANKPLDLKVEETE